MSQLSKAIPRIPQSTSDLSENDTATRLFEQLQALSNWANDRKPLAIKLASANERKNCMVVVRHFYEHVIYSFPSPAEYPWGAMHEKIRLIEASFDVFSRVGAAFCAEEDFSQFAKKFFIRVYNICHVLEDWMDVPNVPVEEGYPSPRELYERGEQACIGLLRAWFGCVKLEQSTARGWQVANDVVAECLALCQDLLSGAYVENRLHVCLFETPRLQREDVNAIGDALVAKFILNDRARHPLLITSMIKIALQSIKPYLLSDWHLTTQSRSAVTCAIQTFHFLLSPLCVTLQETRTRALIRLVESVVITVGSHPAHQDMAETVRARYLARQLTIGPDGIWDCEERAIHDIFASDLCVPPSRCEVQSIVAVLASEEWGEDGKRLRASSALYLSSILIHCDLDIVGEIKSSLSHCGHATEYYDLLGTIEQQLERRNQNAMVVSLDEGRINETAWRKDVKIIVQTLIEPKQLSWMDDDDTIGIGAFIKRAATEVWDRYRKGEFPLTTETRISLAIQLGRLSCALARHADLPCSSGQDSYSVQLVPTGYHVAMALLKGPEDVVTSTVAKTVFDGLTKVIRHHTSGFAPRIVVPVCEAVGKWFKHRDRNVRLSAGHCFVELTKIYSDKGQQGNQQMESIFKHIDLVLSQFTDRFRETALITAGLIARQSSNSEILYRALSCLISQLGHKNPAIKGTAYTQLASVAELKGKSRYGLMRPYMDQIAIYMVDRLATQPTLLTEYCSFLGASRADFFTATLDIVIPHLFATCNSAALQLIANERSCDVAHLALDHQAKILAHAHMTTIPGQRQRIISFILTFFKTSDGQKLAGIVELIKSCIVDIVSELVMQMGDEDEAVVQAALQGIMKVEDTMRTKDTKTQPLSPERTLGEFIEKHILGVLAHMVEILEDTKGKRSIREKKCVCRAVGKIVQQMGHAVNAIAPQIMAMLQTMLSIPELHDTTLQSWNTFLRALDITDIEPYIGPTAGSP